MQMMMHEVEAKKVNPCFNFVNKCLCVTKPADPIVQPRKSKEQRAKPKSGEQSTSNQQTQQTNQPNQPPTCSQRTRITAINPSINQLKEISRTKIPASSPLHPFPTKFFSSHVPGHPDLDFASHPTKEP
ncbi:hypothetical protein TWF569_008032 [Orbilia oligospora]|uniref:Uncharacterized protein n=1 Tax=Orbilia oligospora TaxID=2813651 RepID=A0A7C8JIU6_ORBOL|nr:hypothetical protein TWF706_011971 [Orbilia oligospora]KAF3107348.1 hypothetical protein TWF102_000268 [Orbilia oligospora]KAF3116036.1 hypothetical protein TWF103_010260 [Orbilia oligospora]KAF3149728.1 hypothetical protein TWF594_010827 [Orbilia oligospora]KAF3155993.1 hypothetical protein TWF569_008032 [Orbilia oligospora]